MDHYFLSHANVKVPKVIYGTAWKKDNTANLVELALKQGFRGIDTACQPKHYNEPLVGEGIEKSLLIGLSRKDLYIQTKFTPISGQDPLTVPYNKESSLAEQVFESCAISLKNLKLDYIDCLVLHSPLQSWEELLEVWTSMESLVQTKKVKQIGISNCYNYELFVKLYNSAKIKPAVLQNRFYQDTQYDCDLRTFCVEKDIIYQSFWTLSANPHILSDVEFLKVALEKNKKPAQLLFSYLNQKNVSTLCGTTSENHMKEVVNNFDIELSDFDIEIIEKIIFRL